MKRLLSILFLSLLLAACAPAPAAQTSEVSQTSEVLPTFTATPAPTETPTPVPTYSIEQLQAMTSEQVMALAPEAPAGAVKSLYREAPGLVFYQDPETLNITSAYDLTTAVFYDAPEKIPMPPIRVTTNRDILAQTGLRDFYTRGSRSDSMGEYLKSDKNLQDFLAKLPSMIKDTVLDGEEPFYRLRILQDYRDGLIPNIPDSVPPPKVWIEDFRDDDGGIFLQPFGFNGQDSTWFELENRSYRDVTIVSDGAGGFRLVQVWKQADGSIGTFWYHLTGESLKNENIKLVGGDFKMYYIFYSVFDNPYKKIYPVIDFRTPNICFEVMQDAEFCEKFISERELRQQAIKEWIATLMVPMTIQNGQIQFIPHGAGQN